MAPRASCMTTPAMAMIQRLVSTAVVVEVSELLAAIDLLSLSPGAGCSDDDWPRATTGWGETGDRAPVTTRPGAEGGSLSCCLAETMPRNLHLYETETQDPAIPQRVRQSAALSRST